MDPNQQKEQFSLAYLRAVAAVAGYNLYRPEVDDDSVDCEIAARGTHDLPRRPRVELQLKCSSRSILHRTEVRYPLKIKNYDDLRTEELVVPRILVVVIVPEDVKDWIVHSEQEMALRHCGYWASLRGQPETPNTETVSVRLPRSQRLTPEALQQMMKRINEGDVP